MSGIRAILFTLLGAALTGLFIYLLMSDPGTDRNFAIGGALFFGACTLVPLASIVPAAIPAADMDGSITIPNSKARSLAMASALFAVTAAALMMWPHLSDSTDWRRFVFLLIPIPCAFLGLKMLQWGLGTRPALRFDRQGVTRYQWGERTTPWNVVTNVRKLKVRGQESVVLDVAPEHRAQSSGLSKFGAATGFGDVTLAGGATGVKPDDLLNLTLRFWQASQQR